MTWIALHSPAVSTLRHAVAVMISLAASSARAEPRIGDPIAGLRIGYHETTVYDQTTGSPIVEVEGGGFADRRVALTLFGRNGQSSSSNSGSGTCQYEATGQRVPCSWASSTSQTDLALGVRMRVFIVSQLSVGGTVGFARTSYVSTCQENQAIGKCANDTWFSWQVNQRLLARSPTGLRDDENAHRSGW